MKFFSRSGQDRFIFENFFRGKRDGVFVDVGGHHGEEGSHSLFFERFMGWRGLRVERMEPGQSLAALLEKHDVGHIDYCSLDAGGAEMGMLSELNAERFDISVLAIGNATAPPAALLIQQGYEVVAKLEGSDIFKRRGVKRLARTSVICAVWHGDADRVRLLAGHAENLSRQSVPIEPVYVFDGRDVPPDSIPGRKIVVQENLSIYQAWNVALSLVETPLVMNLNLDDRLAPDAIERLEDLLAREGAALAGGDWKICYTQGATDAVEPCYPAERLPFLAAWPPQCGSATRLGSGTAERGTFGPATIWRMDAHVNAPRYPWRLPDGTILRIAGDAVWWTIMAGHLKKKMARLPQIIGNYHSHPQNQAEFRAPQDEIALMNSVGISLL